MKTDTWASLRHEKAQRRTPSRSRLQQLEMEMYGRRYPEERQFYGRLGRPEPLPPEPRRVK